MRAAEALAVLAVSEGVDAGQVCKAYLKKALGSHPDKGGDVESFRRVQEAYEVLRHCGPTPKKRGAFRCADCGLEFKSGSRLRLHRTSHPPKKCSFSGDASAKKFRRGPGDKKKKRERKQRDEQKEREEPSKEQERAARAPAEREERRRNREEGELRAALRQSQISREAEEAREKERMSGVFLDKKDLAELDEDQRVALAIARSRDDANLLEETIRASEADYRRRSRDEAYDPLAENARANLKIWSHQVVLLIDLGFAESVAAAYADCRVPLRVIVDRMLDDAVDFAEEPVWQAREVERESTLAESLSSVAAAAMALAWAAFLTPPSLTTTHDH